MLEVFVCRPLWTQDESAHLTKLLQDCPAEILHVSQPVFEKLAFGHRAEGVLGVAEMPRTALAEIELPETPLVAVLEGVEKPGNLGAVLRSADGAGLSALIAADPRTDLYNPNAIRASLGTIFGMPVAACTSAEALAYLRSKDIAIVTARVEAELEYDAAGLTESVALVVGAETTGLSDAWKGEGVTPVSIPMLGLADSLNVSASAAVLFYEARRQRRATTP